MPTTKEMAKLVRRRKYCCVADPACCYDCYVLGRLPAEVQPIAIGILKRRIKSNPKFWGALPQTCAVGLLSIRSVIPITTSAPCSCRRFGVTKSLSFCICTSAVPVRKPPVYCNAFPLFAIVMVVGVVVDSPVLFHVLRRKLICAVIRSEAVNGSCTNKILIVVSWFGGKTAAEESALTTRINKNNKEMIVVLIVNAPEELLISSGLRPETARIPRTADASPRVLDAHRRKADQAEKAWLGRPRSGCDTSDPFQVTEVDIGLTGLE